MSAEVRSRVPDEIHGRTPVEVHELLSGEARDGTPVEVLDRVPRAAPDLLPIEVLDRVSVEVVGRAPVEVLDRVPVEVVGPPAVDAPTVDAPVRVPAVPGRRAAVPPGRRSAAAGRTLLGSLAGPPFDLVRRMVPIDRGRRAIVLGTGVAALLSVVLMLAPPLGTDLSAQAARAEFTVRHGATPVDLRWYGGTTQYGYTWVSSVVMAALGGGRDGGGMTGARLTGVLALLTSTLALALVLLRWGARRPVAGTVLGALAFAGNLVSGRVTFALGLACGLWALVSLTVPRRWLRYAGAIVGAAMASATSPVAGLFTGMVGAALAAGALTVARSDRKLVRSGTTLARSGTGVAGRVRADAAGRVRADAADRVRADAADRVRADAAGIPRPMPGFVEAVLLTCAAAVPLLATQALFGSGGVMNIGQMDTLHAVVTGLAVAWLVPVLSVRFGALLSSIGVLLAFGIETPVGLNATRLITMFALPVVAACATLPRRWLVAVLVALAVWQPPVMTRDLREASNPTTSRSYFAPLLDELARRRPVGRIEVPPTRNYWEAAYVADTVPLARGWLRQVDIANNPLFFTETLRADDYLAWLRDNGVSYVALPDAKCSWISRTEVLLIRGGLPYLHEVWRDRHWVLYEVAGSPSIVEGATLVASTGAAVTFEVARAGQVLVRVTPSRWLTVRGPGPAEISAQGRWSVVSVTRPGRYTVSSGWTTPDRVHTPEDGAVPGRA